jgi:ACS family hexuronate transporter-like MFS transporter
VLGFFEAGQWPCALVTAQRLLSRRDRALGNSIIQSGASLGAMATPAVVWLLTTDAPGSWRLPFRVIGASGLFWVFAWLLFVPAGDVDLKPAANEISPDEAIPANDGDDDPTASDARARRRTLVRRFVALAVVVVVINLCWQYFRAWMPKMLREEFQYSKDKVQFFSMAYYLAADVGCLSIGFLVKLLASRGFSVHRARMTTFLACSLLTALSMLAAALPASSLLLATLLVIGFGSLGQFPTYYAFTQELSARKMGNVTGVLSFLTWMFYAVVSGPIGRWADRTGSYSHVTFLAGLVPMLGFLAVLFLWDRPTFGKRVRRTTLRRG